MVEPASTRPDARAGDAAPVVVLRDVGKAYANGIIALDGLDLAVSPGEFLSLLGPSGCGKSTALRLIAGLGTPSRGSITWPHGPVQRDGRGIGFVFQEPTLMPWATAFDNVFLPLRLAGVERDKAAPDVAEALARVGLADA